MSGARMFRGASISIGVIAGLLCAPSLIASEIKTFTWQIPTHRTDGQLLPPSELSGHRLLCQGTEDVFVPMPATAHAQEFQTGEYTCTLRARDTDGAESADSGAVSFVVEGDEPGPVAPGLPVGLGIEARELLPPSTGPPDPGGGLMATLESVTAGASTNSGSTLSVNYPETDAGDLLYLFVWRRQGSEALTYTTPSGWTLVGAGNQNFSSSHALYRRTADGSETGSVSVTASADFDGATNGRAAIARVSNTEGHDQSAITIGFSASNAFALTGITPTEDNSLVLTFAGFAPAASSPADTVAPSGHTRQMFAHQNFQHYMAASSFAQGTAGATGSLTWTSLGEAGAAGGFVVSALPAASGGSTVEATLETGAEAGAGFNARVVSRADIAAATSAGSSHGASSTIRAAITEGATAQQVASGVASMAAQLAESTLAGAEVTARAALAASITEGAGAGEAVSRQAAALEQMIAAAEADAILSAYLHAVAALAAGVEAGDAWAARLTAAATFSGAAEASGTFSEDSVAQIAAESEAGALFAAAVHALAEHLEEATAGATMAGIVSTLAAFSSASSADAVFESAMRHADALQAGAEAGAAFSGITGELTGHLLGAVSAAMVVNSAHQARATWSAGALAGASFVASGDVSALIGALAFVVAAEQRVFTVPAETRTFIVS